MAPLWDLCGVGRTFRYFRRCWKMHGYARRPAWLGFFLSLALAFVYSFAFSIITRHCDPENCDIRPALFTLVLCTFFNVSLLTFYADNLMNGFTFSPYNSTIRRRVYALSVFVSAVWFQLFGITSFLFAEEFTTVCLPFAVNMVETVIFPFLIYCRQNAAHFQIDDYLEQFIEQNANVDIAHFKQCRRRFYREMFFEPPERWTFTAEAAVDEPLMMTATSNGAGNEPRGSKSEPSEAPKSQMWYEYMQQLIWLEMLSHAQRHDYPKAMVDEVLYELASHLMIMFREWIDPPRRSTVRLRRRDILIDSLGMDCSDEGESRRQSGCSYCGGNGGALTSDDGEDRLQRTMTT